MAVRQRCKANVVDLNGNALAGAPVSFATSAGMLSGGLVNTDTNGNARDDADDFCRGNGDRERGRRQRRWDGNRRWGYGGWHEHRLDFRSDERDGNGQGQSAADRVDLRHGHDFSGGDTGRLHDQRSTGYEQHRPKFERSSVSFGDGTATNLGAVSGHGITVQHRYDEGDTYTATVRVTDTLGTVVSAATVVVVLDQPPLNRRFRKRSQPSAAHTNYTLTATVTPPSIIVANYRWNAGARTLTVTRVGGSNQVIAHVHEAGERPVVTVEVTTTTGATATASVFLP